MLLSIFENCLNPKFDFPNETDVSEILSRVLFVCCMLGIDCVSLFKSLIDE